MTSCYTALLWGVVGALAYLVLHQGYLLFGGTFLGFGPVVGVTLAVFGLSSVSAFALEAQFDGGTDDWPQCDEL